MGQQLRTGAFTAVTTPTLLGELVRAFTLPTFVDHRGALTPIAFADWGFEAVRAFVVTAPADAVRGGHAHRECRQVVMRVDGVVDVQVRHGETADLIRLDGVTTAVLIEAGVWSQQTYVTENAAIVVFAASPYDPDDYVDTEGTNVYTDVDDEMARLTLGVRG